MHGRAENLLTRISHTVPQQSPLRRTPMTKFTQIAAAGSTIYLIDEHGKAWCVEYYGITERERWQNVVHPDDLTEQEPQP